MLDTLRTPLSYVFSTSAPYVSPLVVLTVSHPVGTLDRTHSLQVLAVGPTGGDTLTPGGNVPNCVSEL